MSSNLENAFDELLTAISPSAAYVTRHPFYLPHLDAQRRRHLSHLGHVG